MTLLSEGPPDALLRPNTLELAVQLTRALNESRSPRVSEVVEVLAQCAHLLLPWVASEEQGAEWDGALAALVRWAPDEAPTIREIRGSLFSGRRALADGRARGMIQRFFRGKGGLLQPSGEPDLLPFPNEAVSLEVAGTLVPGTPVSFELQEAREGRSAQDVQPDVSPDERERILRRRKGTVVKTEYSHLFAVDRLTGVFVFIHQNHFARPTDWELVQRGDEVGYDLALSAEGKWRATRGSAHMVSAAVNR
jgi:hypothetical protein